MGDRPVQESADSLRNIRDEAVPHEVDGVLELVRGDAENVRRLVERATRGTGAQSTATAVDPVIRRMVADVRGLGDDVTSILSGVIDELEHLVRPADEHQMPAAVTAERPADAAEPPIIHISGDGPEHAAIRKNPPPNAVIAIDNAAVYWTDDQGRVVRVRATLVKRPPAKRNPYAQRKLEGKLDLDDGGHLIASVLGGTGDEVNLVPMGQQVNRSHYATLENGWRKVLEIGGTIDVEITVRYAAGRRPTYFVVAHGPPGEEPTVDVIRNRRTKRKAQ